MVSIFSESLDPSVMSVSIAEDKTEFLQIKGKFILTHGELIFFVSFKPFCLQVSQLKFCT